ncbi:MAG: hypothetical protein FD153_1457 [Rhodospirillaceae bacterium]|nr:MAG: hypothetical protein FD153_1457 [Rhodospirillaceae bacterium]
MGAGTDPCEAAEMAEAFAAVGATRLLVTRLDLTRRLGVGYWLLPKPAI